MLIQQLSGAAGVTYYSNTIFRKAGLNIKTQTCVNLLIFKPES